jgi:4-hydroxy-tetrahydrodipicolinate synthase
VKNNLLRGVTTALITPFLPDKSVDYQGLRQNVKYQIDNGVSGLLPLGTTGETPTLTEDEKREIVRTVVQEVKISSRPVKVLQGVGTNSTEKTIKNALQAIEWGVDAILVVSPYYNKPTQQGLLAHFTAVNDVVNIPIVVYNIWGRTGVNIETGTLQRIAELENVVAVKEASGDINQMMDVLSRIPALAVYSGDDGLTFPLVSLGGQGVISVVSNLFPDRVVAMTEHALEGRLQAARNIHFDLLSFFKAAFIETNPAPIKYAMSYKGMAAGPLRLPLVEIRDESKLVLEQVLNTM